mmetsp:Transcript_6321/g.11240  ORF Transcript_6321/g.11240 Transcript_6321/m.11240 type:complete len:219 (+) Transcript_6321:537-1193(+)
MALPSTRPEVAFQTRTMPPAHADTRRKASPSIVWWACRHFSPTIGPRCPVSTRSARPCQSQIWREESRAPLKIRSEVTSIATTFMAWPRHTWRGLLDCSTFQINTCRSNDPVTTILSSCRCTAIHVTASEWPIRTTFGRTRQSRSKQPTVQSLDTVKRNCGVLKTKVTAPSCSSMTSNLGISEGSATVGVRFCASTSRTLPSSQPIPTIPFLDARSVN